MDFSLAPRKILMTADAVGGVWTYALELARALEPHGVQIVLAVMGPAPSDDQRAEAKALSNLVLHEGDYALEWMDNPWRDVDRAGQWLLEVAEDFEPDLIHLNGYVHAALPWSVPVVVVAHSCVLSWWSAVRGEVAPSQYQEYENRVRTGLMSADLIVAPSRAMLRSLETHYGKFACGEVIHNARVPEDFPPAAKAPKIFAAGRAWDDAKNLRLLDSAAAEVRWPIYLAGDCRHPDGENVAFQSIRCLGKLGVGRMRAHLAESAIYALPARYEPFGLSALEAALSGCALVLGDIPSLREVWGDAALYVDPDDKDGLVQALNTLSDDASLRAEMAHRARGRALRYTPSTMAERYMAVYRRCIENSPLDCRATVPVAAAGCSPVTATGTVALQSRGFDLKETSLASSLERIIA